MGRGTKNLTLAVSAGTLLLGLAGAGCSAPPGAVDTVGAPSTESERPPLDPLRPGASIVCDAPDAASGGPAIYMLSAMNHKLRHYPAFAAAAGIDLVEDCESGHRFVEGYGRYLAEHPGVRLAPIWGRRRRAARSRPINVGARRASSRHATPRAARATASPARCPAAAASWGNAYPPNERCMRRERAR